MKNYYILIFTLVFSFVSRGQTVISDNVVVAPESSARLQVESTTKGILIPRLTTTERDMTGTPIGDSPVAGLLIYNTTDNCFQFYDGADWNCLSSGSFDETDDAWENDNPDELIQVTSLSDGSTARANGNLFFVRDSGNVIIGDSTDTARFPDRLITAQKTTGTANFRLTSLDGSANQWMASWGSNGNLRMSRGNGTLTSPELVLDDDVLGQIDFWAYTNRTPSNEGFGLSALQRVVSEGDALDGDNRVPTRFEFRTTGLDKRGPRERLRISADGNVGINTFGNFVGGDVSGKLQVETEARDIIFVRYNNDATNDLDLDLIRAAGTKAAPVEVTAEGFSSGGIRFRTFINASGTNPDQLDVFAPIAEIRGVTDGTMSTTSAPGRLEFRTTPTGSISARTAMELDSQGQLSVNKTNPNSTLDVNGSMAAKIRSLGTGTIANDDYTIIVTGDITVPAPSADNTGRIYVLMNGNDAEKTVSGSFSDGLGSSTSLVLDNLVGNLSFTIQSDGSTWWIIANR